MINQINRPRRNEDLAAQRPEACRGDEVLHHPCVVVEAGIPNPPDISIESEDPAAA